MQDKTAPILAMLIVLVLIYLSNSGKLAQIRALLSAPATDTGSGVAAGANMALSGAINPGESTIATQQIDAWLRAHGLSPQQIPPGTIGGGQ